MWSWLLCTAVIVFLRKKNPTRVRCFIWQSSHKQPWPVSSISAVGLFLLSEHAWPTRVAPPLTSCHKFVWSSLCYQKHCIIPSTNGKWTFQLIRYTYVSGMYAMNTSFTWRPVLGFSIYALEVFCIFYVGLLDRAHIYAAHTLVRWRAIPYDHVFRSSTTNALLVLYNANALWLVLRLIHPGGVYTVWSIGRKHADEHAWLCLTSHIRVIFAVRPWYYCSTGMFVRVFVILCCM